MMTREEAINYLKDVLAEATETEDAVCYVTNEDAEALERAIEALQEQKTGHWVETENKTILECSCCHSRWNVYYVADFDYCPCCGMKMEMEE